MVLRTRRLLATAVSTLFAAEESTVEEAKEKKMSFAKASNLGFPRMGKQRELKFALEKYWRGELDEAALLSAAQGLRADHWRLQREAGIETPPSNDFSLYDHVLDMAATPRPLPARFKHHDGAVDLKTYFAMARRGQESAGEGG